MNDMLKNDMFKNDMLKKEISAIFETYLAKKFEMSKNCEKIYINAISILSRKIAGNISDMIAKIRRMFYTETAKIMIEEGEYESTKNPNSFLLGVRSYIIMEIERFLQKVPTNYKTLLASIRKTGFHRNLNASKKWQKILYQCFPYIFRRHIQRLFSCKFSRLLIILEKNNCCKVPTRYTRF